MTAEKPLRCRHCGDVIGVYEPLVALTEGRVCETSLAANADRVDRDAVCYHHACYVLLRGAGPSEK